MQRHRDGFWQPSQLTGPWRSSGGAIAKLAPGGFSSRLVFSVLGPGYVYVASMGVQLFTLHPLSATSLAMSPHNPFASDRFRLPPEGLREYATSPASPRRRLWFEHPTVAFIFGIVLALIAKQVVHLHSTIMGTFFLAAPSPFTPNRTNLAPTPISPSIHHSLPADAALASISPRNLALFGGGARVNYFLTSATYDPHGAHSVGVLRSSLRWVRDTVLEVEFSRLHMSRPRDALSENMELGRCWEFEGSVGHIAIELPDVGTITHVSVAYVPVSLLSHVAAGRAPRGVTIWGLVNATTAEHFPESRPPSSFKTSLKDPPGILPSDKFIRLGEFVFDINASLRHQFFAMDPDATTVKTSLVVMEVNSNHGSSTTCLYYLGVYGLLPVDDSSNI
ncbi:hypothetical protein AB1N83_008730 [Pleurotus pulmonarius]